MFGTFRYGYPASIIVGERAVLFGAKDDVVEWVKPGAEVADGEREARGHQELAQVADVPRQAPKPANEGRAAVVP